MKVLKVKYKNEVFRILVDNEDYEWIKDYNISISNKSSFYAQIYIPVKGWKYLHREIIAKSQNIDKTTIDHIDRNPLNNQKSNLRIASIKDNTRNVALQSNNKSGFKGVIFHPSRQKFSAKIKVDYKSIHIGYFDTAKEAAIAYAIRAKEYFGKFAYLNYPNIDNQELSRI